MLPKGFSRNTYSSVTVDDTKESYKMVDYLCKNGHKDIAIVCARKRMLPSVSCVWKAIKRR